MLNLLTKAHFDAARQANKFLVVHFSADWCDPSKHLNKIFEDYVAKFPKVSFATLDAEKVEEVTTSLDIETVPHIVFFRNGNFVSAVQGAKLDEINKSIQSHYFSADSDMPIQDRLRAMVNSCSVFVFLTGTPTAPQCGFTGRICEILNRTGVPYNYFDIMTDNEILKGVKVFGEWPTFPQLYVNGELVGGCDIVAEMDEEGTLLDVLQGKKK